MTVWTYIGQIVNFLIFVVILRVLLYKPVRGVMKARRDEMEADLRAAEKQRAEAEKLRAEAEERARELEEKRDAILKEARNQAQEQRKQIIQQAEDQARDRAERFRRVMEQEREDLLKTVRAELQDTIVRLSGAALKDAAGALTDRAIERVNALLADASKEDLQSAIHTLGQTGGRVEVRSAAPLSEDQKARLVALLREKLGGTEPHLDVRDDPALLAGIQVAFGHLSLEAHWRGVMEEALRAQEVPEPQTGAHNKT